MAEATLTPVGPGITQPEDPELPDSQQSPEAPDQEPEDNFDDVLALLSEVDPDSDKPAVPSNDTGPSSTPAVPRTEAEIEADVAARLEARNNQQETVRQRSRQIEGMRSSFRAMDGDVSSLLAELGITQEADVKRIKDRFAQHNGHWNELYQTDVKAAHDAGVEGIRIGIWQSVAATIGKDGAEEIIQANHQDWKDVLEDYSERSAKKKGLKSAAEVKDAVKAGQTALLKRFKDMGVEIPRGGEGHIPAARSGSSGIRMSKAAFEALSIPEQLAVPGAERARIYADDAAAQARNNRP